MLKILFYLLAFFYFFNTAQATPTHPKKPMTLSLEEAILLSVRDNPNVQSSQLNNISQKFNLWIQEWEFHPHYSFSASANLATTPVSTSTQPLTGLHQYNVQPAVTLLTPIGTQLSLTAANTKTTNYNPGLSLQIQQPLMRGFGKAIVETALNNAKDTAVMSQLMVEGTLRSTITAITNAYLNVVMANRTVIIDEDALRRAEQSVEQTKLFIKAGHLAGNELITVRANVASAQTQLENDKNSLAQSRYALLAAIGLDPNTEMTFTNLNLTQLMNKYRFPPLDVVKRLVLENDIQYQIDQITLHGPTRRMLLSAEDNTRWILDLNANATLGNGSGGGQNAGINSLFNGVNQAQNIGLSLQIPIDDQVAKQGVLNAKIALKQAELSLLQEKWEKETSAINNWNSVNSAARALHYAEDAEKLQRKTYSMSYQKYLHGLIDGVELQTAQTQLIQSEQGLLNAKISYLRALVNLDFLIGNTLRTWHVSARL